MREAAVEFNLGHLLAIVNRSSVADKAIAAIASRKANATRNLIFAPIWFATWVGVDPAAAIPALVARFASTDDPVQQTKLALAFIVALVGGRSQEGRARQAFRTVEHMKSLYLLMARYIRQQDDIDRAGKGVYSPGLRDDAQDARNALMAFIQETPGKEAFLALHEMGRAHPDEHSRPWMSFHAKTKAAADADVDAWTPSQVREFAKSLVATPANHRELWYHAVDKLDALKHDLENGDSSIASILQAVDRETEFRKFLGGWCRDRAAGRYVIPQEEELGDRAPGRRSHIASGVRSRTRTESSGVGRNARSFGTGRFDGILSPPLREATIHRKPLEDTWRRSNAVSAALRTLAARLWAGCR